MDKWIYDIETYPNCFTIAFEHVDLPITLAYEISDFRNDSDALMAMLRQMKRNGDKLIGYNNVGFDYPVVHMLIKMGRADAATLYEKAMSIIKGQDEQNRFASRIKPADYFLPQIDLFLIHHFDNGARATSLKALEFNMRSDTIEDLPFPVGTVLNQDQIAILKKYNAYDVNQTKKFYHLSKDMMTFRDELTAKYKQDFTNKNDTAIGKSYFVMELEKAGVMCYDFVPGKGPGSGRQPRQTPRPIIHLRDAILPWIQFEQPEFNRVMNWMKEQSLTETKGALKEAYTVMVKGEPKVKHREVAATIDGFKFVFGTGGIHGSREFEIITSDEEYAIIDLDVTSYYPNLAIVNGFYPQHLGETFCHIYKTLFEQRKQYDKKSAESAMLKLALNGVYGDSNNKFSVFYDPLFTMRITLNGQLLLCVLAEQLMKVHGLQMIQVNTDGVTVRLPRKWIPHLNDVCAWWSRLTALNLESVEYKRMCIRDVNNYLAVTTENKVKRKGDYDHNKGWHQDAGYLVVPKVAEMVLVDGVPIRETIEKWPDLHDFMLRIKVRKSDHLVWGGEKVQNTTRYLVTKNGKPMVKWMAPLPKEPDKWRQTNIESGWLTQVCNNIKDAEGAVIDYSYYVNEVEKLVMGLK